MFKRPNTDFWQAGIVPAPIETLSANSLTKLRDQVVWLPPAGDWRYLADPFGLVRGDTLHVFVEAFDYRRKHAVIERHDLTLLELRWQRKQVVLARPFHLSFPLVFEHDGDTWMLPESHRANEVALYRGNAGLDDWQRECALLSGLPVADATLAEHDGRWWMFYTLVGPRQRDQRELHVAWAPQLSGPWTMLADNPVRVDLAGARPAGWPYKDMNGALILPVQDCSQGYGSATRLLRFDVLTPERVSLAVVGDRLTGDLVCDDHTAGFHTLSACGNFTLIDVKRIDHSRAKQWLDIKRRLRRLLGS